MTEADTIESREQASLRIGKYGNLFMGCAGVLGAWLSNSQAVLVDGLFSLIGLTAAIFAGRVGKVIGKAPDQRRPLGYAVDESLFTTFRALTLLGLVGFATGNAVMSILRYVSGAAMPSLNYTPLIGYFLVVIAVCFTLAFTHFRAWKATGKQSRILLLEGKAAVFDGLLSLAAGAGLAIMPLLKSGPLGWLTPIGDSVVVLFLCGFVVTHYYTEFMNGLGELGGAAAPTQDVKGAREKVAALVAQNGGRLVDLSAVRFGRSLQVQIYYDPERAISAEEVDDFTNACDAALAPEFGPVMSITLISRLGMVVPQVS